MICFFITFAANNKDNFKTKNLYKMKKVILTLLMAFFAVGAFAQNEENNIRTPNALGVRLSGGNQWYCAEISYQRSLGAPHRIEADLGYRFDDFYRMGDLFLVGVYQLHFDIPAVENLGWYFGFGPRLELFYYDASHYDRSFHFSGNLGVTGQIGVDYHFKAIPLQLALDFRPCLFIIPNSAFLWRDFGIDIRYCF